MPARGYGGEEESMIDELLDDAKRRMDKSVEATQQEFNTVRTGRASAALLDRIMVDYYGQPTPVKQLATLNVPEPRLLTIQPFDPSSLKSIERAIMESDLGLQPGNDGKVIRLPIPQLTEERRKELVRVVHRLAEDGRVAVRNVRRDVMHDLKELARDGDVGDDEERRAEDKLQKLTDEHVHRIDDLMKKKEAEILEV
jgi:ribosome recycling factor